MKYSIFLTSTCLFLSILIGGIFLFPKYQNLSQLKASIGQKKLQLENQERYFNQLQDISKKLEGYKESINKIDAMLPSSPDFSSLIYFFNQRAKETGMSVERISISPPSPLKKRERIKEYTISLDLSGSYPSLRNLLLASEKSARLLTLENLNISVAKKEGQLDKYNLVFKVHSY
jgi:Tfp pilus assembly protein PilO